jgi:hypothetical protein
MAIPQAHRYVETGREVVSVAGLRREPTEVGAELMAEEKPQVSPNEAVAVRIPRQLVTL